MAHEIGHLDFDDEFLRSILEEQPRAVFGASVDQFGPTRRQRSFFDTQFDDIFRSFEGETTNALLEGRQPQSLVSRFEDDSNFFRRLLLSTSPVARGNNTTRLLAPTVSFIPNVR